MKTPNEKQLEGMIEEMKPKGAKGLARLQRKRWGRPTMVLNAKTGEIKERILEHKYSTAYFRISHRKLQLLADQIGGGKPIDYSILQMQFSQKRASKRIKSTLVLAKDHAVAKGLDASKLVVSEAWVGKGRTFKKMEIKGRGRMGIRKSFQAKLSVVLREGKTWQEKQVEKLAKEKKRVHSIGTGGVVRTNLPVRNTSQRAGWQW
jgi:large subunit ribosomal protein L22